MASKKHRKSRSTKRRYRGGFVFSEPTYNPATSNPYTTYDVNKYDPDPSREIQNARNLVGGKRRRTRRRSRKTKGGFVMPLRYGLTEDVYGNHHPKLA